MGCVGSAVVQEDLPIEHVIDREAEAIAVQQRRRLTVAPHHVGEIDAAKRASEEHDRAGLSTAEAEAKSGAVCVTKSRKGVIPYNNAKVNQDAFIVKYALQVWFH